MTLSHLHASSQPRGIRYVSLWEASGYAVAARRQLVGLKNAGVPVSWTPVVRGSRANRCYTPVADSRVGDPVLDPLCHAPIEHDWVLVHSVPEYFPSWVLETPGKRHAGITVWETDRLPHSWPPLLNRMDRVLVPCRFNRETFVRDGVRAPIHLLPHIAPGNPAPPRTLDWGIPPSHFVFYTINTWTARKALWLTLRAYLDAFTVRDPVTLVIKTTRQDLTRPLLGDRLFATTRQAVRRILRQYRHPASVVLLDRELPEPDLLALHGRGDCYVSLTRAEGWGLGAFDAAAYGKPVIITAHGGQLDYLLPHAAHLVRCTLIPVNDPRGYPSFAPDQNWADPSLPHAVERMRSVVENAEAARANAERIRERIHEQFNEKRVTDDLLRALEG